jgi:hypothetical protein
MEIISLPPSSMITSDPSWSQLLALYGQIKALWEDMQQNPHNEMADLQKMIALAQQMLAISSKLPAPPSAPDFHQDFQNLVNTLEQLQSSLMSGVTNNPSIAEEMKNIGAELSNIFYDIIQG